MEPDDGEPMDTRERAKRRLSQPSSSESGSRRRLQSPDEAETFAMMEEDQQSPEDARTEDLVVYMLVALSTGDNTVYPVSELLRDDYPELMCCQKIGSKLYLFGGFRWVYDDVVDEYDYLPDMAYPNAVYSIDTSTISPSSHGIDPRTLLAECNPMSSGKPHCQSFVIDNMLYAISPCSRSDSGVTRFEKFDPVSGVWSQLPDPPFKCSITSDAMVKNKLMVGTSDGYVYLFDAKELTWINIGLYFRGLSFQGHCTVLDDILYSFTYRTLFAFGPTTMEDIDNRVIGLFKKAAYVAMPLYDVFLDHLPLQPLAYLNHWGKRVFCLGIVGPLQVPGRHMYSRDPEKGRMGVIVFRVPKKDFIPPIGSKKTPCFEADLLHEASYVFRSRNGAEAESPTLLGCFSNYTGDE